MTQRKSQKQSIKPHLLQARGRRALQKEGGCEEIVWWPSPSRERKGVLNEAPAALCPPHCCKAFVKGNLFSLINAPAVPLGWRPINISPILPFLYVIVFESSFKPLCG